jgi:ribosomal protein S18 acetylase RimI-like enzyme
MSKFEIRAIKEDDRDWVRSILIENWASPEIVSRGRLHHADQLPGFIVFEKEIPVGLITYSLDKDECEIVTVDSLKSGKGIGALLIDAVFGMARESECKRVWLITTNDNLGALRFYQKIGFELVAIHRDAIKRSRELKPSIPEKGFNDIPIRDEFELEKVLIS